MELTTVADDQVVVHDGAIEHRWDGLTPGREYNVGGFEVTTLAPRGELLCRIATVNDLHFGETECGRIEGSDIGPVLSVGDDEEPYPELMNRNIAAEIECAEPDAVVVKGDITADGADEQFERFRSVYGRFDGRLHVVRGNHDSYHGATVASTPTSEITLEGVVVALLDTARPRRAGGSLSAEQLDWLDELGSRADRPVLVMGHHNCWNPDVEPFAEVSFGIDCNDSLALLATIARRPRLIAYFAGHTHRNELRRPSAAAGAPIVQVSSVKDFPGSWAEYRIHEGSVLQIHHRCSDAEALAWTERTRHMYDGAYAAYAFGELGDRCFQLDVGR